MTQDYNCEVTNKKQLARAYVLFQIMDQVFDTKEALRRGTLFPELYSPYKIDKGGNSGGKYYG